MSLNKSQNELLDKCIEVGYDDKIPLFKGMFIIPQRKLHDSGYKMMYVIGHTDYDSRKKDFTYYLIGTYSDVLDFTPIFDNYINNNYEMCDIHMDINRDNIIHIWTNSKKYFRCQYPHVSSCSFEIVGGRNE